jgi:D-alanine--poly(phosphoribitol) ligase subunit 1
MKTIIDNLKINVKKHPQQIIFGEPNKTVTYQEFYDNILHIASGLTMYHKQPIALYMNKGIDLITAMMAVTLSGNFYSVIDSAMPTERIDLILDVLKPVKMISNIKTAYEVINYQDLLGSTINEVALNKIAEEIVDTNPMYILFTSGSTGIPKGVVVSHRAVIAYLNWFTNAFKINNKTIFANQTPLYFSMSVSDCLGTIYGGATLYFIPKMYFSFPLKLIEYLNTIKANTIYWVPSALNIINTFDALNGYHLNYLKKILFAGETMPTKCLNYWMKHVKGMYANLFGPTETTDICTYYVVKKHFKDTESLPIGIPCDNCGILIIKDGKETNDIGELYVKGSFLADGYYNNPEKTSEAFVQNPLNKAYPEITYRTGDLVKMGPDGNLLYYGRKDYQIKHMGYRIELGEIENRIYAIAGVTACAAIYVNDNIILYYEGKIMEDNLIKEIKKKLPNYMAPNKIIKIPKMRYNMNGKVDHHYFTELERNNNG